MDFKERDRYLLEYYCAQCAFQKQVIKAFGYNAEVDPEQLPLDVPELSSYHLLSLLEELGELVKSDKRWKNYRNTHFDKENKLEELADCFIVLMNVAIFSGIMPHEFEAAIFNKMAENMKRIKEQGEKQC